MTGALALGVVNGLALGLLAAGLVLVFRAGRVINLAHAQLGVVPAMLLGKAVLDYRVPWFVAFPVVVGLGAGIGAACHVLIVRRLEDRSPLTRVVASLGVAQILIAATYFTWLGPNRRALTSRGYPVPFDVSVDIDGFVLRGQHVLIAVLVPALALLLAWTLRATLLGKSIRALATNPDAARLAGLPTTLIGASTWAIAGGLSAVSAVLAAPGQAAFDTQALGPALLVRALGVAALVGFAQVNGAVIVGVLVGVAESIALYFTRDSGSAEALLVVAILVVIGVRAGGDRLGDDLASFRSAGRDLVVPPVVRARWWYRRRVPIAIGVVGFVAGAITYTPPLRDQGDHFLLTTVVVVCLVAVSITLLTGWMGLLSLGQFAYVGLGAYVAGHMVPAGWSLLWVLVAAGAVGAVTAIIVGGPGLRLGGPGIAVATLGLAVVTPGWVLRQHRIQPGDLFFTPPPSMRILGTFETQRSVYFLGVALLGVVVVTLHKLRATNRGRDLIAVRDNPNGASAIAIAPGRTRLTAFALSGAIAAMAGVIWVAAFRNLSTLESFNPQQSLVALSVAIIGGVASLPGAIAAAIIVVGVPVFAGDTLKSVFSNSLQLQLFLGGAGLVATQLQFPGGIADVGRRLAQHFVDALARQLPAPAPEAASPPTALAAPAIAARGQKPDVSRDAVLAARDLSVSFGGVRALDGCSIDVRAHEIVGLIGGNGAGKSTLLNVVSGFVRPDAGSVLAFGTELVSTPPAHRPRVGIGRSFQDARLFPDLTVRDALMLAGESHERAGLIASMVGAPWVRQTERRLRDEADAVIERLGLGDYADTKIAHLSTGTRRIADLAVQVILRPRILLLDEPTAGVSQREAEAFGPLIRRLAAELSCSVLLVEHDMPLMFSTADRVYCLEAGRVLSQGSPAEIRADPAVIASYLGTDPTAVKRSGPVRRRRVPSAAAPARASNGRARQRIPKETPS